MINQHTVTVGGPQALARTAAAHVQEMPGLPVQLLTMLAGARADVNVAGDPALEADPLRASLIDGLVAAGEADQDVQEPSWELLGRLLQDVTFVQAYRRLEFFRSGLGLPPASYEDGVKIATELLANHPYVSLLRAMPMAGGAPLKKAIGEAKLVNVDLYAYIEIHALLADRIGARQTVWPTAMGGDRAAFRRHRAKIASASATTLPIRRSVAGCW